MQTGHRLSPFIKMVETRDLLVHPKSILLHPLEKVRVDPILTGFCHPEKQTVSHESCYPLYKKVQKKIQHGGEPIHLKSILPLCIMHKPLEK